MITKNVKYLMQCGHVANATNGKGEAVCVICDCEKVVSECSGTKGLEGRFAICSQHKREINTPVPSRWELPFFEYRPDKEYDLYYCGCYGWD